MECRCPERVPILTEQVPNVAAIINRVPARGNQGCLPLL